MMKIRKFIYIFAFTILGIMISFMIHYAVEIAMINLLLSDFTKFSLGLSWQAWFTIHYVFTILLLIIGLLFGYLQGKYWWNIIYVKKTAWVSKFIKK